MPDRCDLSHAKFFKQHDDCDARSDSWHASARGRSDLSQSQAAARRECHAAAYVTQRVLRLPIVAAHSADCPVERVLFDQRHLLLLGGPDLASLH